MEIFGYIEDLVIDWIGSYVNMFADLVRDTISAISISFSISISFKRFLGIPIGIDKFSITGSFSFDVDRLVDVGVSLLNLGGNFFVDWYENVTEFLGLEIPTLNVEFSLFDEAGISYVKLWVNPDADFLTTQATETRYYNGAKSGRFFWSDMVDITFDCDPEEEEELPPFTPPDDRFAPVEGFSLSSDTSISSTSNDDCNPFGLKETEFKILVVDVNGNARLIERTKESLVVQTSYDLSQLITEIFPVIDVVVEFVTEDLPALFNRGQELVEDFGETLVEVGQTVENAINEGFRYVWENIIHSFLFDTLENNYNRAKNRIAEMNEILHNNRNSLRSDLNNQMLSSGVLDFLGDLSNSIDTLVAPIIEPIGDLSDKIDEIIENTLGSLEIFQILITAVQTLQEKAIKIISEVVARIVEGIFGTILRSIFESEFFLSLLNFFNFDDLESFFMGFDETEVISDDNSAITDFLNPLSMITPIADIVEQLSHIDDYYTQSILMLTSDNIIWNLLEFLTSGNENDTGSSVFMQIQLFSPIMALFLSVEDLLSQSSSILPSLSTKVLLHDITFDGRIELDHHYTDADKQAASRKVLFWSVVEEVISTLEGIEFIDNFNPSQQLVFDLLKLLFVNIPGINSEASRDEIIQDISGEQETRYYFREFLEELFITLISFIRNLLDVVASNNNRPQQTRADVSRWMTKIDLAFVIYMFIKTLLDLGDVTNPEHSASQKIGFGLGVLDDILGGIEVLIDLKIDQKLTDPSLDNVERNRIKDDDPLRNNFDNGLNNPKSIYSWIYDLIQIFGDYLILFT